MTIYEPSTTITDLILGIVSIELGRRLSRTSAYRSRRLWSVALVASGVAALLGALFHGAGPQLSRSASVVVWKLTTQSVGIVSFSLIAAAAASSLRSPGARRALTTAAGIQLAAYSLWMLRHNEFIYVVINYAVAMVIVASLQFRDLHVAPARARLVLSGIAISIFGGALQASRFSLHQHFNHNDIYHVIQLLGNYVLYRAGKRLDDVAATEK